MSYFEFKIESYDGLKLHGQSWEPDSALKAVVCLVHGLGEHCGRYAHMAEAFNHAGYALIACDLRGHGKSEGQRGHASNYAALMADLTGLLDTAATRYADCPRFLYGHSLGGNLVIHYALRQRPDLAGIIASAPLLRLAYTPPHWKTGLLRTLRVLRIHCTVPSGLDDRALSRDINVVRAYRNDPLTHNQITPSLAVDMIRIGEWNMEHAAEFPCSLLLMHGAADRITSARATQEFALRAGATCTLKIWDGFFHELHNDPGNADVLAFVLEWMEGRAGYGFVSNTFG